MDSQFSKPVPNTKRVSTGLVDLPAELLEKIAEAAETKVLKALRLVCREINSKVLRTYTQTFFSNIAILYNDETSLLAAQKIARHTVFGPCVNSLTLFLDHLPAQHIEPKNVGIQKDTGRTYTQQFFRLLIYFLKDQLTGMEIFVCHPGRPPRKPVGLAAFPSHEEHACGWESVHLKNIGEALHECDIKLKNFTIDLGPSGIQTGYLAGRKWTSILSKLEQVDFNILNGTKELVDRSIRKLTCSANLGSLRVDLMPRTDVCCCSQLHNVWYILDKLFKSQFPRLEHLTVRAPVLQFNALFDFVKRQPMLKTCNLPDGEMDFEGAPDKYLELSMTRDMEALRKVVWEDLALALPGRSEEVKRVT